MKKVILTLLVLGAGCATASTTQPDSRLETAAPATNSPVSQPATDAPDLVPYVLFHDFETGEKFGWEAYPYEQDVGTTRHFFTRTSPTYNDSNYALQRPFRANDATEAFHGFTRRLNMWTTSDTRLQVAIFLQSDRDADTLELSLGTFDGRRYMHTIRNPKANRWLEIDLPVSAFEYQGRPLSGGEHIQVVTIKGTYETVYYLNSYTIVMDDFRLNGERQRRFLGNAPESTHFEKLEVSILNRHYFFGDTMSLSVSPEDGQRLVNVTGTLVDSRGRVISDRVAFSQQGGEWVNNAIHRFREQDERGQWQIQLTGETVDSREVQWAFRFLVPGNPVTDHPRLFFSRDELRDRIANEQSPVARQILDRALENTDFMDVDIDAINQWQDTAGEALAGGPYGRYSFGFGGFGQYRNPMHRLGDVIREGSFRYAFTGDREAGEKAKEALLKLSSFTQWSPNWMLDVHNLLWFPVGYVMKPVAYGYDMLHDLMTEQERALVREAIMEKGLKLFQRDMVEMNRMPSNVSNHSAVLASGHGLAAMAIYGEDPNNPHLEPFLSGIIEKARVFIDRTYYEDGSYGEPYSYMDMASRSLVEIAATFERNLGVDWSTTTDIQNFYKYPIQATHPSGLIQSWGDTGRNYTGFGQMHAMWFVHRLGNPYVYDYVKPFWEEGNGGYMGYLWFRDDITPISRETLPTSRVFEARGMVMRSGWEDESTIITNRIGPNSNHYHYDMGSFQIMTNGVELISDPGIGRGGYYGGRFVMYDIHSIAHNVMLLNHDAESQAPAHYDIGIKSLEDWPRMTHAFTSEIVDAVEGDLAIVYKDKLESYTRTLLYRKSGPLFLIDRAKSKTPEGHVFSWLFHAPQNGIFNRSIAYDKGRLTIDRPGARLTMDIFAPEDLILSRIYDNNDERFPESFATFSTARDHMDRIPEVDFFAVLLPEAEPDNGAYGPRPVTTRIAESGWLGARVEHAGVVDIGLFRQSASALDRVQGFATDSERLVSTVTPSGQLINAYFEGSRFAYDGMIVESRTPLTAALTVEGNGVMLEVDSSRPTELQVALSSSPSQVVMNGSPTRIWTYNSQSGRVVIQIPEGRSDLVIY